MTNNSNKKRVSSPREEAAKAAILAKRDTFAEAGVIFVAVHFDGYGDDGVAEQCDASRPTITLMGSMNLLNMTHFACRNILKAWFRWVTKTTAADLET